MDYREHNLKIKIFKVLLHMAQIAIEDGGLTSIINQAIESNL